MSWFEISVLLLLVIILIILQFLPSWRGLDYVYQQISQQISQLGHLLLATMAKKEVLEKRESEILEIQDRLENIERLLAEIDEKLPRK